MFRKLRADEIDCRVATVKDTGCSLLLYKDARCDQNILDETVGPMNWMRSHSRDNANCTVSIWDKGKKQWISKEDTGTESYTEKEKGLASDSFKRACFNWGIGRELYTAPFIWIDAKDTKIESRGNGKGYYVKDSFTVTQISYDDAGRINALVIKNKAGKTVFSEGATAKTAEPVTEAVEKEPDVKNERITEKEAKVLEKLLKPKARDSVLKKYGIESLAALTKEQYAEVNEAIRTLTEQKQKAEELKQKVDAQNGNKGADQ